MVNWRRGWGQSVMKMIQCNGLPEIHVRLMGGPSVKVGSSAKSFTFHALLHRRSFHIPYEIPNDVTHYVLLEV